MLLASSLINPGPLLYPLLLLLVWVWCGHVLFFDFLNSKFFLPCHELAMYVCMFLYYFLPLAFYVIHSFHLFKFFSFLASLCFLTFMDWIPWACFFFKCLFFFPFLVARSLWCSICFFAEFFLGASLYSS